MGRKVEGFAEVRRKIKITFSQIFFSPSHYPPSSLPGRHTKGKEEGRMGGIIVLVYELISTSGSNRTKLPILPKPS